MAFKPIEELNKYGIEMKKINTGKTRVMVINDSEIMKEEKTKEGKKSMLINIFGEHVKRGL